MSVYKQVRKSWLKQLNKEQRKQLKDYIQDIADEILEAYSETIRLNNKATKEVTNYMPIDTYESEIYIHVKILHR